MRIILMRSVDKLGTAGDSVDVRPGYYRNYLGPRGIAVVETDGNRRMVESRRKFLEAIVIRERGDAEKLRETIQGVSLEFSLRANDKGQLFGSVTTQDITEAFAAKGFEIDRRKVELGHPIKTLGEHKIRLRLYPGITSENIVSVTRLLQAGEMDPEQAAKEAHEAELAAARAAADRAAMGGDDDDDE
ncbi:MAG: 50S ribosomal protein L9 [Candidatus Sumerlaeia bacterium]|nr:50S ribosomal protein L9 [Candidatus Sumerlaeia bacterium]